MNKLTNEDYIFLSQHYINFEQVKLGFLNNVHPDILARYEQIYKRTIDPGYVLTIWCSSCVMSMMKRLIPVYESYEPEVIKKQRAKK